MDATSLFQKRAQLRKLERLLQASQDRSKTGTQEQPSLQPAAAPRVSVPSLALARHAHDQLASAEPVPLATAAALPLTSVRSEQEEEPLRSTYRLTSAPAQVGYREGDSSNAEGVDTFYSVAQVQLAYKKRMRGMEAAQKRMHLSKVRHTTKRMHPVVARSGRPSRESEEAANEATPGGAEDDKHATHVTLDGLSFRKYSVDLEYRNTITRACRLALMQGQVVVLRAPLDENDNDLRECRMVLQSVYMQVSALARADLVPEAVVDSQAACTTMTLQPRR